jgi:uncharacterized protein (DUF1499 family)
VDFKTLKLTRKPNQFLVAPDGYCQNAKPHLESKVYEVAVEVLHEALRKVAASQPRVTVTEERSDGLQFVQKSKLIGFPDFIDVQFLSMAAKQSTLLIYSRSKYGRSDFGVNAKRIRTWLAELDAELANIIQP